MDRDMTFAAARERVVREWPGARFVERAEPRAPVLWITRGPAGKGSYRVTIAIAVEHVSPARVRIVPYALGTATRVVPRAALFVCECDWCQEGTVAYTCICRESIEGIVIAGRHTYLRRYPRELGAERARASARRDWEHDPASFVQLL